MKTARPITVGTRKIGSGEPCFFIAEAGVNHNGDERLARALVDAAADAGADAVKFQAFDPDHLVTDEALKADYQMRNTGSGGSQKAMLAPLALSQEQFRGLKLHCEKRGIVFLCTPFDDGNARFVADIGCPAIKVGSGDLTNHLFLCRLARLGLPLLLSTGMADAAEVRAAVEAVREAGNDALVLLHCVSNYPATPAMMNLRVMGQLAREFGVGAGLSDHTLGDEVALAAVALGACVIEKHLTLDRALPGPDHAASMEPRAFAEMVRKARSVESALGDAIKRPTREESRVAAVARRSLAASRDIEPGTILSEDHLIALRPAGGIQPCNWKSLVGKRAAGRIPKGTHFQEEMFS